MPNLYLATGHGTLADHDGGTGRLIDLISPRVMIDMEGLTVERYPRAWRALLRFAPTCSAPLADSDDLAPARARFALTTRTAVARTRTVAPQRLHRLAIGGQRQFAVALELHGLEGPGVDLGVRQVRALEQACSMVSAPTRPEGPGQQQVELAVADAPPGTAGMPLP